MKKIGEFIYPWGNGHYHRMMILNSTLQKHVTCDFQVHFISKGHVYRKLLEKFPKKQEFIHKILMPTPIDGNKGPSAVLSLLNLLIPICNKPPLIKQIIDYITTEGRLYDGNDFDLVINDGDIASNVLAHKRNINSIFITNQFMPKLWYSHFYFYPALVFISKQISKAKKILVADSPPPYTLCEYNLNFPKKLKNKVTYVGHFIEKTKSVTTKIESLLAENDFGYWMRTGNKSTNNFTGKRYNEIFITNEMKNEKRIISHAKSDKNIDGVIGVDGKKYSISNAIEKKISWKQIDVGFLSEQEKQSVLRLCKYVVINGSHTVMGEIIGVNRKPVIGIPVYDEHTNQLKWVDEKCLGILANNKKQVINAITNIKNNYNKYIENIRDFSKNFICSGADNAAKIVNEVLEDKM